MSSMVSLSKSWIEDLQRGEALHWLQADAVSGVFPTRVLGADEESLILENRIPPEYIHDVVQSKKFVLHTPLGLISSETISSGGRVIRFPSIAPNLVVDGREHKRFSFEEKENVYVEILNPFDRKTLLKKRVLDLSVSGLSFQGESQSKLLVPGVQMQGDILVEGQLFQKVKMEVVYSRKVIEWMRNEWLQVGAKFLD